MKNTLRISCFSAYCLPVAHVVGALVLVLSALSGCGGGSDGSSVDPVAPPTPTPVWRAPVLSSALLNDIEAVYPDAADGFYIVGYDSANVLQIQRYSASGGWAAPQAAPVSSFGGNRVAIPEGVAFFTSDGRQWLRQDFTATGSSAIRPQFPVVSSDAGNSSPNSVTFSRAHDGSITAASLVPRADAPTICRLSTQVFQADTWMPASVVSLPRPDGTESLCFGTSIGKLIRTRYGDVTQIRYNLVYVYSYVAFRAPAAPGFTAITAAACTGGRCFDGGGFAQPVLEADGAATVFSQRFTAERAEWLAVRGDPPSSLFSTAVSPTAAPIAEPARQVRSDGVARYIAQGSSGLELWEGPRKALWPAGAAMTAPCPRMHCAALSAGGGDQIAVLQNGNAGSTTLHVSTRAASADNTSLGQWSLRDTVDLGALRSGEYADGVASIIAFQAAGNKSFVVGTLQAAGRFTVRPFVMIRQ